MKKDSIFGLQRNVFFAGLTSFLTDTSTKMIYSVMPLFLLSIGASKTSIALIEGIAESTASLFKAFSGYWSDKIGKKKVFMVLGYGITTVITPLYALVRFPFHVLVLRFLERIGKGLRAAPRDSLISVSVPRNKTGVNFGFHKAMDNSGAILGPLVALLLLRFFHASYVFIFLFAALPAVLGVLSIAVFITEKQTVMKNGNQDFTPERLPRKFYFFLFVMFVFTLGNSTDALLLVKTAEAGIDTSYVPFVYMLYNTVSVLLAIPVGKISDKTGRELLIILGFLVYSLVYFLFGKYLRVDIFMVLFIFYGVYSALVDGSQKALISDIVTVKMKGTGYGLYHAMLGITLLPASLIAGLLYDTINSNAPFYFGSIMALVAAFLMLLFVIIDKTGKRRKPVINVAVAP